jgi:hypothetical protein
MVYFLTGSYEWSQESWEYPNLYSGFYSDVNRYRVRGPHVGHRLHLCELAAEGRVTLEEIKSMAKNAKFICKSCGRAAAEEIHLCDPVPLESTPPETKKQ